MLKLVIDSFIWMEIGLVFFLYLMYSSLADRGSRVQILSRLATPLSESADEEWISPFALFQLLNKSLKDGAASSSSFSLLEVLSVTATLCPGSEEEALVRKLGEAAENGAAADKAILQSLFKRWGASSKESNKKGKKASEQAGEDTSTLSISKKKVLQKLKKQMQELKGSLPIDQALFLLNVVAGYGYLMGILAFYWPASSSPTWMQSASRLLMLGLSRDAGDWAGNFAGDLAWTLEPLLIICSPLFTSKGQNTEVKVQRYFSKYFL